MKKLGRVRSIAVVTALIFTMATILAACGGTNGNNAPSQQTNSTAAQGTTKPDNTSTSGVSGSAMAVGSSALQPLAEKAAQMFMEKNKDARIQVQGGGSGTGLTQVSSGGADIGNSDLFAEEKLPADQAKLLVDHKVCVVGFATVVNPKVKVDNLTKKQLIDIFTGKITNWKDVGGDDMKIVIINRPSSSGTRATFKKYALDGAEEAQGKALTEDQSGTVRKAVAETEGAISYLAFSYIDSTVKPLKYENIEPTADNVKSGQYPLWSYEHMYTKGEAQGVVKAFLDFIMSDEFKTTITELGYIPNSEMKVSRDK
ncbi:MAG: phosphate ABC transporter substrate-binding protein [Clostridiales bacterium]|nr:phosphate ABC transporter substrate-binding protein [Eubacteriales bacterium]MDH7565448.1 phosphate ABC transporter substrate-binding protein [Clostridiales bacterium]